MEITTAQGVKFIKLAKFSALDGWEMRDQFTAFANSHDAKLRRSYVQRVMSHACVVLGQHELPLRTGALIDNHLCTAENIGLVFHGLLAYNGINARACADRIDHNTAIGNEIATSFVAACTGALEQFVGHLMEASIHVR